ncbi:hypothetical protein SAY86_011877 [Trapa natans]|uniref:Partial AB-hydrolase lipase domain-containing protein n=1 Tax=Trapa natans TaxID=22666 RepID=A0AAN7MAI6_TRANT|nr:hypothetical protein SAY86_011877 [Trapa natans]
MMVLRMQRLVDNGLAVAKESVKTITYESLNNIVRFINGVSAILLSLLPGKSNILEGIHGWELRPTFRGPGFPRWMENGVSSFNQFIHELSVDSDTDSSLDYSEGEYDTDEDTYPPSPLSQSSRRSRTSSFSIHGKRQSSWIRHIFSWVLSPLQFLFTIVSCIFPFPTFRRPRSSSPSSTQSHSHVNPLMKAQTPKDHVIQRTTDRRRGVIEDLHLAIEIFIEAIFDIFHKAAHYFFSPTEAIRILCGYFSSHSGSNKDTTVASESSVIIATLGDNDHTPSERKTSFNNSLNTDARTCQDVITELGYPYEAIRVVTDDGYVLLLERIPRRDSRKAVYLQHGILDSSMGWVSNGVVGSPAFAAYDQGYDVFLGNFRGLISREHVNKNISSRQYWRYSINEHGTKDIPAMIEKIHEVKTSELKLTSPNSEEELTLEDHQPYTLCAVCHSLGGAAMLMYIIRQRIEEKPHRFLKMILLSPAGFHGDSNLAFTVLENLLLLLSPILSRLIPAFYIPTWFFRMLLNKLARDFHNYPAVGGLVQTLMSYVVGGDSSNWVGVLGLPHYNMNDMPGVSFQVAQHLAQIKRSGKFRMYDHGRQSANIARYGTPEPLDLGEHYGLIDIPVDLVAGKKDKVISASMVRKHYRIMKESGVEVSYREFEYAHLDFTFSHREELLAYVMSRLPLVASHKKSPDEKNLPGQKSTRMRRKM